MARYDLGLSDEEWLEMTPRQLYAIRKRRIENMQREELLIGIVASTSANYSFCRPDKLISPTAFMLHPLREPKQDPKPVSYITGDMIKAKLDKMPAWAIKRG